MEYGKLLVSTKAAAVSQKIVLLICSGLMYLMAIFIMANEELCYEIAYDLFRRPSFGGIIYYLLIGVLLCVPTFSLIASFRRYKSFCDVYENAVVGATCTNIKDLMKDFKTPSKKFELAYKEIMNVSESGDTINIYTQYTTYEVLALKNRSEAVQAIRARIAGQKTPA